MKQHVTFIVRNFRDGHLAIKIGRVFVTSQVLRRLRSRGFLDKFLLPSLPCQYLLTKSTMVAIFLPNLIANYWTGEYVGLFFTVIHNHRRVIHTLKEQMIPRVDFQVSTRSLFFKCYSFLDRILNSNNFKCTNYIQKISATSDGGKTMMQQMTMR